MTSENKKAFDSLAGCIKRVVDQFNLDSRKIDDWPASKKPRNPQPTGAFKEMTGKSLGEILFPDEI